MYDEKIKYFDEDGWRSYFGNDLARLYVNVEEFLNLHGEVIANLRDKTIDSLIHEADFYKNIFFGGFQGKEDKPFVDSGLANFYREGLGISVGNISLIISRMREGLTLEEALMGVLCNVESTDFVSRLTDLSSKLGAIFRMLRGIIEIPTPKEFEVRNEKFGLEAIKGILDAGKTILPRYNSHSFFINSLYSLPYFYAKEAYPRLFEEETMKVQEKYGLRIVDLLEPDIPDEKIREERKLVGWAEDTVGTLVRAAILDVYSLFSMDVNLAFFNADEEFIKYVKGCIDQLRRSIVKDIFSDTIAKVKSTHSTEWIDKERRCKLPSELKFYYSYEYGEDSRYQGVIEGGEIGIGSEGREKLSYSEFVSFLAPQMLLGLSYIRPIVKDRFSWICMMGWLE